VWLYFTFLFLSLFTFVRTLLLFYFRLFFFFLGGVAGEWEFFFLGGGAGEWECNGIGCGGVSFLYGDVCCQIELY